MPMPTAKRRARRYGQKRLQDEIRRNEHRGGDGSYAAWEERQREEMEAFKRSIQGPEPEEIEQPTTEELEKARNELYRKKMPWLYEREEESSATFIPDPVPPAGVNNDLDDIF